MFLKQAVLQWSCVLALLLAFASFARADDALARQRFETGVAAAAGGHWQEAAESLEESLSHRDKPATRFNLAVVYHELHQPLEVARHALPFLALPADAAHEPERAQIAAMLSEAKQELACLDLSGAPRGVLVKVDGASSSVADGPSVFVLPGRRVLEIIADAVPRATIVISLGAGQVVPWAILEHEIAVRATAASDPPPVANPQPVVTQSQVSTDHTISLRLLRKRTAWSMGVVGAALAVAAGACMWTTIERGHDLSDAGTDGTDEPGYILDAERYLSTFRAVIPLALTSGTLMAGAIPVGAEISRRGSLGWSIAALSVGAALLGVGAYWLIREPSRLIDTVDDLDRPSRQAGSLLVAGGLPLTTYGVAFLVQRRRPLRLALHGISRATLSW